MLVSKIFFFSQELKWGERMKNMHIIIIKKLMFKDWLM